MFAGLTTRFHASLGLHAWLEHESTFVHGVGLKLGSSEIPSILGFFLIIYLLYVMLLKGLQMLEMMILGA